MTTSNEETFDRISLYFLAIFVSPILFGAVFSIYSQLAFEDYYSFGSTVFVAAIISFPFFAVTAFPISLYVDFSARFKGYSNWKKAILFAASGSLIGILGYVVLNNYSSVVLMLCFGIIGGLCHFFVLSLIKKIIR